MKQVSDGVPIVESGTGSGWPQVKGRCPACGASSLFLGSGGYVTCSIIKCPNPTALADALMHGMAVERRTNVMSSAGMTVDSVTGKMTHHSDMRYDERLISNWRPADLT